MGAAGSAARDQRGAADKDLGWILLAFAIFNTYMLLFSTQLNLAVFPVFLTLELTEIFLFIGNFAGNANIVKIGGFIGIVTALAAWYTSAAGVINGMKGRPVFPVGGPLFNLAASRAGTAERSSPEPGNGFVPGLTRARHSCSLRCCLSVCR